MKQRNPIDGLFLGLTIGTAILSVIAFYAEHSIGKGIVYMIASIYFYYMSKQDE